MRLKKIKKLSIVLGIILITCVAFWGVFEKKNGVWKNSIPDYRYGMDIEGARELGFAPSEEEKQVYMYVDEQGNSRGEVWKDGNATTAEDENSSEEETNPEENAEEKADTQKTEDIPYAKETRTVKENPDEALTKKNFEQAKKIIQERLKKQNINEYHIRIDDVTGKVMIENANDSEEIDLLEELVTKPGKFEIKDYQNGLVLMDHSDIKNATVVYSNQNSYNTYLQIQFNKEGAEKLREISKKYVEIKKEEITEEQTAEEENSEEETNEEETEKKYVSIVLDDSTMMTTYFGEEMTGGVLQIAVGQARDDYQEFQEDYQSAKTIADIINSGVLPVTYELETDNFVKSTITADVQRTFKILAVIGISLLSLISIVKFKKNGVWAVICNIGYMACFSLILKYTNVEMTIYAILVASMMVVVSDVFLKAILKKGQTENFKQAYREVSKRFYLSFIPVIVVAIVFTLTNYYAIGSVGMVIFWGMILNGLYHFIVTKTVLENGEDE